MPTTSKAIFTNHEKKPLEDLILNIDEDGVNIKVSALNKRWITRNVFSTYFSLVASGGKIKVGADLDEWLYEGDWFHKDMEYLLSLKHYEFWSYMVYEKSALTAVVSFLQRATPFYMDLNKLTTDKRVINLYEKILNSVLRVVCRIITNKESKEEWITKEHLRELIYKNFLITVPMLLDLIIACGDTDTENSNILRKVYAIVFQIEPNYKEDLKTALQYFKVAFKTIQIQAENEGLEGAGGGIDYEVDQLETPYDDVVLYTLDCAYTLSILLDMLPESRSLCSDINFAQNISHFYDNTIPYLYKNIYLINETAVSLDWLNQARVQYLKAFRSIAYFHVETALIKPDESLLPSENFVALLTECLSERTFVIDYQREYPVVLDMEILKQACKDLDDFKADFVAKGFKDEADSESVGMIGNIKIAAEKRKLEKPCTSFKNKNGVTSIQYNDGSNTQKTPQSVLSPPENSANGEEKTSRDLDLEVTSVLDVLPYLGNGFVRRVLSRYENSEDAIAAILEENLPPDLVHADQTEVYIPQDIQDTLFLKTGVKHYNVFDGDAYDIMTQDNPACIIKQGKGFPNTPQNAAELLDDKSDLKDIRHRYQEYSLVAEGGGSDTDNEYKDEYDDSYEALLESETRVKKSKQLKAGLADVQDNTDDESEEEDEKPEEQSSQQPASYRDKKTNFCENPEDIRARYEANRNAKYASRSWRSGTHKSNDVVGAAKGQGQEKQTLINRHKKDVNKSTRANHNRKAGASFKRSKGMMA